MSKNPLNLPPGQIIAGDSVAQVFLFTADQYDGHLWHQDGEIHVWMSSPSQEHPGSLEALIDRIERQGYKVKVSSSFPWADNILRNKGFIRVDQWSDELSEMVNMWQRRA